MQAVAGVKPGQDPGAVLVEIARALALELNPQRRQIMHAGLESSLERDWGFDSLSSAELLLRVERAFSVRLPQTLLGEAETLTDLLPALAGAAIRLPADADRRSLLAGGMAEPAPAGAKTLTEVLDWHVREHGDRVHVGVEEPWPQLADHRQMDAVLDLGERVTTPRNGDRPGG